MDSAKQIFYKGRPYPYKVVVSEHGERRYLIYEDGVLVHFVHEDELDHRRALAMRLERLFSNIRLALFA